jgi:hypothetical protein
LHYLFLCLAFYDGSAQSASLQMGARAQGMGYASSCHSDVWALTNNIAGLAKLESPVGGVTYHAIPSFNPFDRMAAVAALPVGWGVAGISSFRFGDDLYNEHVLSMGFANSFGLASLGVKINWIQYRTKVAAPRTGLTFSFGGIAALTPALSVGAHIVNINQPVLNDLTDERMPTRLMVGMALKLSEKLIVAAEIEEDLRQSPTLKSGIQFQALRKIAFRSGFNLHPEAAFFGLGFKVRKFELDYAVQWSYLFGLTHQATVTFALTKK